MGPAGGVDMELNKRIVDLLDGHYVDLVGFADMRAHENDVMRFGGPVVSGYPSAVSIGIAIPDSIVDFLPSRQDANVACEYRTHGYEVLNDRLNIAASALSSFLNAGGHRTLPVPAANRTDFKNATPSISHKMVAHIAGLGWIGKNCLLVTPEYGPRVRFISVLTEAPVRTVDNPLDERCGACTRCADACPVGAIRGVNYAPGDEREVRLDFKKCSDYFEKLAEDNPYPVCGMCLHACPAGKKRAKREK